MSTFANRPRSWGALLSLAILLGAASPTRAQYYYPTGYGYDGWGFGGWGGTAQGSIATGLGYFAAGEGIYNYNTAVADAIETNTWMKYNEYLYNARLEAGRRFRNHEAATRREREIIDQKKADRLADAPTQGDIENGNALNVILDEMTSPRVLGGSSLRMASGKIDPKLIRDIPFRARGDAITICLDDLTDAKNWPEPLLKPAFDAERTAYARDIDDALAQAGKGDIAPATVERVRRDINLLYRKATEVLPRDNSPERTDALNYLKGLAALSRMLERPQYEKVLGELDKLESTSTGNLLAFMHTYNLRFDAADTPRQREVYRALYPVIAADRERVIPREEKAATKSDRAAEAIKNAAPPAVQPPRAARPTDVFRGYDPRYLYPPDAPATPAPAAPPAARPAPKGETPPPAR